MPEHLLTPADGGQAERLHTFAHDIKNRLNGLWEALRMLRDGPPEGMDKDELMAFAERGFFGAQRDLENLLDDFAVDRGVSAERQPFDLVACLNEALKNETYRIRKKDQRVDAELPERAMVLGDARWTTQLIQALISNASKFSPRGSAIAVALSSTGKDTTIIVGDTGRGLSADDLENVFTRYAILSSRSVDGEPQARGTLARAKQWAEAQGGTLSATSEGIGRGSAFTLTLATVG